MTINEVIACLTAARDSSPLGGDTVLVTCLVDSEIEYLSVTGIRLDADGDGALCLLLTDWTSVMGAR